MVRLNLGINYATVNNLVLAGIWLNAEGIDPENPAAHSMIEYNAGTGGALRSGSKAVLRLTDVNGTTDTEYDTLAEAEAAKPGDNKDGYVIIDLEQPVGSANSIILEHRPSLHPDGT